jgi:hypothetical protein
VEMEQLASRHDLTRFRLFALHQLAELCRDLGRIDDARQHNQLAQALADQTGDAEAGLEARLTEAAIIAAGDRPAGIQAIRELLTSDLSDPLRADGLIELFRLTNDRADGAAAAALLSKLHAETNDISFKMKKDALTGTAAGAGTPGITSSC